MDILILILLAGLAIAVIGVVVRRSSLNASRGTESPSARSNADSNFWLDPTHSILLPVDSHSSSILGLSNSQDVGSAHEQSDRFAGVESGVSGEALASHVDGTYDFSGDAAGGYFGGDAGPDASGGDFSGDSGGGDFSGGGDSGGGDSGGGGGGDW
jgi:hypothetical protein